uniref:Phlebovirus_G2 domain-containing protein n=1 Tax=Angiostrongylus cantonensis TaxID=6313 RepID=A0A0K0D1B2_ANGCA
MIHMMFAIVPLTLGKPIRVIFRFIWFAIRPAITSLKRKIRRPHSTGLIMIAVSLTLICNELNGSHQLSLANRKRTYSLEIRRTTSSTASDIPYAGSCKCEKCAGINATSVISELAIGNKYPGIIACVESREDLYCDCFYWSLACLFHRIYLAPTSPTIYEIFHCNRWKESAKVKITYFNAIQLLHVTQLQPNIPFKHRFFTLTLSSITVPPIPKLNTLLISDGKRTAIWNSHITPPLRCDCVCYPEETQATEMILYIQNKLETNVVVDKDMCTVDDTMLLGCYRCRKAAKAQVLCNSSRPAYPSTNRMSYGNLLNTMRQRWSTISTLIQLQLRQNRRKMYGHMWIHTPTTFAIRGLLKFTSVANSMIDTWLKG